MDIFKFCRLCLVPEENEKLTSLFEKNGILVYKIFKISGVTMFDIAENVPSLVCKKCISDIEEVEKLKLRILDADEYYAMMTREKEKKVLKKEYKRLTEITFEEPRVKTPVIKTPISRISINVRTPAVRMENKATTPPKLTRTPIIKLHKIKIKQEKFGNENKNSRKRKLEVYDDDNDQLSDIPDDLIFVKPPATVRKPFLPNATPNKLGIHRMIINKSRKSLAKAAKSVGSLFKPTPAEQPTKKRIVFRPRLSFPPLRPRGKKSLEATDDELECENCAEIFKCDDELQEHLVIHNLADLNSTRAQ